MEKVQLNQILTTGSVLQVVKLDENDPKILNLIEKTQQNQTKILKLKEVNQENLKMVVQL